MLWDILNEKQPVPAEMAARFGQLLGNDASPPPPAIPALVKPLEARPPTGQDAPG